MPSDGITPMTARIDFSNLVIGLINGKNVQLRYPGLMALLFPHLVPLATWHYSLTTSKEIKGPDGHVIPEKQGGVAAATKKKNDIFHLLQSTTSQCGTPLCNRHVIFVLVLWPERIRAYSSLCTLHRQNRRPYLEEERNCFSCWWTEYGYCFCCTKDFERKLPLPTKSVLGFEKYLPQPWTSYFV